MKDIKINITLLLESIIAICIVLDCESIWKWTDKGGYFKFAISLFLIISLIFLIILKMEKMKRKDFITLMFICIYFMIFILINMSSKFIEAIIFSIITILLFIYLVLNKKIFKIVDKISNVVMLLSIVSIIFFVFGNILKLINTTDSITIYVNNLPKVCKTFFHVHYEVQREATFNFDFYINTGIFYEAPKYALILTSILMYEIFILNNRNYKRNILFTITIFTTLSLTGIYAVIFIWLSYYLFKYSVLTKKGLIVRVLFFIIFIILSNKLINLFNNLLTIKSSTASYDTRIDNYISGFKAWIENPFWGAGFLNMDTIKSYYSTFRLNDIGYSNSLFRILAQGGIYLFAMYIFPLLSFCISALKDKKINYLLFSATFIYLFITTSFSYNYIMIVLLCIMIYLGSFIYETKIYK